MNIPARALPAREVIPLVEFLADRQRQVDAALDRFAPPESAPPQTIHRAMRYSLFAGGKRIQIGRAHV